MSDEILENNDNFDTQKYFDILSSEDTTPSKRVETFIELSNFFVDKDFSNSFKYASLASIVTNVPRADACCCLADRYLMSGEYDWAIIWYKHAMNNACKDECDSTYWTYLPLRNLAQIYYLKGQKEEALKLIETLLLMRENDKDLLELKKIFSGK